MFGKYLLCTVLATLIGSCFSAAVSAGPALKSGNVHHEITVKVIPEKQSLDATDCITIPARIVSGEIHFLIHDGLNVNAADDSVRVVKLAEKPDGKQFGLPAGDMGLDGGVPLAHYKLVPKQTSGDLTVTLHYSGRIYHPVEESAEEYARSFSVSPGIISDTGAVLSGTSWWVPWFNDDLITFDLTTDLPEKWDSVSQGRRTRHATEHGRRITRWESPEQMDEVYLIAAPFTEYDKAAGRVNVMAFLREPDERLAGKYLETTAQYMDMYSRLIGPYPYSKFALVENFWETGYGMPSFTLLGPQIIRFPFILHSSYPHELLHNWWGNSVFVNYETGNWCEGTTVYMADHLIKEQRGLGEEYRRATLQKYKDYVNKTNDFPLTEFRARYHAPSEAVGYGKGMMVWHMLRRDLGDALFIKGIQKFYRDNKFKRAAYADLEAAFEAVSHKDLSTFFDQWVKRTGAPQLSLGKVETTADGSGYALNFTLSQFDMSGKKLLDKPYILSVPVLIRFTDKVQTEIVKMDRSEQTFQLAVDEKPVRIDVDPRFDLFRVLHREEIPPSLSQIFGAEKVLIILPSGADPSALEAYRKLAETWADNKTGHIQVKSDTEVTELPKGSSVWIFGRENKFMDAWKKCAAHENFALTADAVRFDLTTLGMKNNSFVAAVQHPNDPDQVLVWLNADNLAALKGLRRKLPHYGKYSYLGFEGDEPTNILKGHWTISSSPMTAIPDKNAKPADDTLQRRPLAELAPVFSEKKLMDHVRYLAGDELKGRGLGTPELDMAADYIADQFKQAGLIPLGDDGTYFQKWTQNIGKNNSDVSLQNVIGMIPGTRADWKDQSVIVSAHYDHLGLGWPDVHKGDEGKIHHGADDNASGVSVLIELANLLNHSAKPERTVIFIAFTAEERGWYGSKHYVADTGKYPLEKVMADVNLDTVGRLNNKKILVLGAESAREWKHILMGVGFVTGIESEVVSQPLDASDQVTFIRKGIPAIQIFSGPHRDYHRPSDTVDKIDSAGLVKVGLFTREIVQYLAERDKPLTRKDAAPAPAVSSGEHKERTVSTGIMPDFAFSGSGVRIASIDDDSPADKAGLREGDVVVALNGQPVTSLRDYSDKLKEFSPGNRISLTVNRNGTSVTALVWLSER